MKVQGARYTTIIGELYRRGFFALLLKCLTKTRSEYVLEEIHKGICGVHTRGQSMATHVQCVGYYWPTIGSDCIDYVKKCSDCQKHGNLIHQPANELHKIVSPWPFAIWGMGMLGPFLLAKGQCKFLLIAVDYFTKWIKVEPLATITTQNVQKFVWKRIITYYDISYDIITNNGRQFTDKKLQEFLKGQVIKAIPESNKH